MGVNRDVGQKEGRGATRTRVPNLCLDPLVVNRDRAGGKLDADRRPALDVELIADKPREHCSHTSEFCTITSHKLQKHTVSIIIKKPSQRETQEQIVGRRVD